ncbi:LysE/ArgO family amino acid transporter [Cohnella lupini]|uniref:L-lysine exporter family protein LysE/ArgO n=1 Tax=Cohnella lupini TaxID=1294267 RepID=A0A3D9IBT6_9BACL|nr:LysE/ArgO family amino acid transporter [Cohnella lupini]RED59244.1 L-lysine exporter family protein LysE/ArgO [Cohnella lupini]
MFDVIVSGFILALGLILPLGVQNIFVFNQGAAHSRFYRALPVILTASICDTLLILLAVFGVSAIALGISWLKISLLGAGILFLIYMGWVTWSSKSVKNDKPAEKLSSKNQVLFAASVSLLNPHAIMDTVGVLGTNSLRYSGMDKVAFAITCIVVSWLWFMGLAFFGRLVGKLDQSGRFLTVLNKVSALVMWGTALYLALTLL